MEGCAFAEQGKNKEFQAIPCAARNRENLALVADMRQDGLIQQIHTLSWFMLRGIQLGIGLPWFLEWRMDPGEVRYLASAGFLVKPLDVPLLTSREGAINVHLKKGIRPDDLTGLITDRAGGTDEGIDHDQADIHKQP